VEWERRGAEYRLQRRSVDQQQKERQFRNDSYPDESVTEEANLQDGK